MNGKEKIDAYIGAKQTIDKLWKDTNWVAEKLGAMYISGRGYYEFQGIERKGDRYVITVDWTTQGDTEHDLEFSVDGALLERCMCEETRAEAYAELKRIHDEEMRKVEEERRAKEEERRKEREAYEKERRRKQYEELKKEFG